MNIFQTFTDRRNNPVAIYFDIFKVRRALFFVIALNAILLSTGNKALGQSLEEFEYLQAEYPLEERMIRTPYQFNGYTNYWHGDYREWYRYGNLFKMAVPAVGKTVMQSKIDIAEDMGVPGLIMQEGFMNGLIRETFTILEGANSSSLESAAEKENVLIFLTPDSELWKWATGKLKNNLLWMEDLNSHQYQAADMVPVKAFLLEKEGRKIFIVTASDERVLANMQGLITSAVNTLDQYGMHKGWFGVETLLKSVTCTDGHPLDVIGKGMNEGNSWFVFNGYMDFLAKDEISEWVNKVNLPVVTDVGFSPIFGCRDYEGLQVQSMFTTESWIEYAHSKGGYAFREVWDTLADGKDYDGYLAVEGNKEQIDEENIPFVLRTGKMDDDLLASMVLFIEKGVPLNRESMWEAILNRREVGVLGMGKMMGPALYRNTLQMLLLDRIFLEAYFGDQIQLEAQISGYDLIIRIMNTSSETVSGEMALTLPDNLGTREKYPVTVDLPGRSEKTLKVKLNPDAGAMDNTNPVAVRFSWGDKEKNTVAMLDLPPAISVHRLLYGHAPEVRFPVTIHNFTEKEKIQVEVNVLDTEDKSRKVFKTTENVEIPEGAFKDLNFQLQVPPGAYQVEVTALGISYTSQLGVGEAKGDPYVYPVDLNSDGVKEYRMENDSVQVTLLATGARVIEYIVKSRNDNILFKLWPEKAIDDKRPFRKRGYYPYGGFEDFLGQASMETHQVYDAEIVRDKGDFVRVRMWTDYYGNRLEKTFTLYGNSPLLEVRYALTFRNPEANVLGPQPILVLGKKHWTEDVFTIPEHDGLHEYRMKPERYYGRIFHMKEGWNAGYDTKEDITFVGAFPVDQPLFLHMWMNHPRNSDAHHYYAEFQPWTPIFQRSTMYFTYYLWGMGGAWQHGVDQLRGRNLISTR